jgi:hypothetical protein
MDDFNFLGSPDLSIFEIPVITHPNTSDRWRRSHRPHLSDPEWPPKANENWMEIMVVADGPMVQYHGDKLEQYILTLMQIVSFHNFVNVQLSFPWYFKEVLLTQINEYPETDDAIRN